MHRGKLKFYYGPMASGKSLQLLATAYNFQEKGMPFVLIKSEIDDRDGKNVIHSRALGDRECITINKDTNLYSMIGRMVTVSMATLTAPLKWVLVDESQFLTSKQVDELAAVADNLGLNVLCYGLRTDFQTHLFEGTKRLFEIADSLEEIKSSCECGHKCIFNARVDSDGNIIEEGEQIEIGGNERYVSMCRKCFNEKINSQYYTDGRGKDSVL